MLPQKIQSLEPRGSGHQFVLYGDSCSGIADAPHEACHAEVNAVVARLDPAPEFIVFPGDEIIGLTSDEATLRAQWRYWFDVEMAWLDRVAIPIYHSTGNHTVYDAMSERVFTDVMAHLPRNGPKEQDGLSYFVRRGDLLLVFINTLWSGLGGEGHLETDWLATTLKDHTDARWKFVVGHHPVFPVNGYVGAYQRTIGDEYLPGIWRLLVDFRVTAYLCSHILAFDVQCHEGVLQITSAGAGTAHRMPEGFEYLHCVQMAVDQAGLRYQVIDTTGTVREALSWPLQPMTHLQPLKDGWNVLPCAGAPTAVCFRLQGRSGNGARRQTIIAAHDGQSAAGPVWIGFAGVHQRLTVILEPVAGRSPHQWLGPELGPDQDFDVEVMFVPAMGPGGILWRQSGVDDWTGLEGRSAWGAERILWPESIFVGAMRGGDASFTGDDLCVALSWAAPSPSP